MHPLRQRMLDDMQIRNFAPGTQQAYIRAMANFAKHVGGGEKGSHFGGRK